MAHWVKVLGAKLDNLSSFPGTHMVEEQINFCKMPSDRHIHYGICVQTFASHMNTYMNITGTHTCLKENQNSLSQLKYLQIYKMKNFERVKTIYCGLRGIAL